MQIANRGGQHDDVAGDCPFRSISFRITHPLRSCRLLALLSWLPGGSEEHQLDHGPRDQHR